MSKKKLTKKLTTIDPGWVDNYDRVSNSYHSWSGTAESLLWAADALHNRKRTLQRQPRSREYYLARSHIILMLYGLALENLIKGLIVKKKLMVSKGGELPEWFTKHGLDNLADRAGLSFSDDQRFILRHLKSFIESGKYPVSKRVTIPERSNKYGENSSFCFEDYFEEMCPFGKPE